MKTTDRVLQYLLKHGPSGCFEVGTCIDNRRGRISSVNGGGDYAAQMLLGRMRSAGLVRDDGSTGSTRWELTPAGRRRAQESLGR